MSRLSLGQGLFTCCSPCHSVLAEEVFRNSAAPTSRVQSTTSSAGAGDVAALAPLRLPPPPPTAPGLTAPSSARQGAERSDWMPRAAQRATEPDGALFVDAGTPLSPLPRRSGSTPLSDSHSAAERRRGERARLRGIVDELVRLASPQAGGRLVTALELLDDEALAADSLSSTAGARIAARYELRDKAEQLVLIREAAAAAGAADEAGAGSGEAVASECLGSWPVASVVGAHRAEASALLRSHSVCRGRLLEGELARAVVLEFGGARASCARRPPIVFVEESAEARDRLVTGLQILRLYQGAARRLESAGSPGGTGTPLASARRMLSVPPPPEDSGPRCAASPSAADCAGGTTAELI